MTVKEGAYAAGEVTLRLEARQSRELGGEGLDRNCEHRVREPGDTFSNEGVHLRPLTLRVEDGLNRVSLEDDSGERLAREALRGGKFMTFATNEVHASEHKVSHHLWGELLGQIVIAKDLNEISGAEDGHGRE